jgi:hypothetical protein
MPGSQYFKLRNGQAILLTAPSGGPTAVIPNIPQVLRRDHVSPV